MATNSISVALDITQLNSQRLCRSDLFPAGTSRSLFLTAIVVYANSVLCKLNFKLQAVTVDSPLTINILNKSYEGKGMSLCVTGKHVLIQDGWVRPSLMTIRRCSSNHLLGSSRPDFFPTRDNRIPP
jgi:hypothetical protein